MRLRNRVITTVSALALLGGIGLSANTLTHHPTNFVTAASTQINSGQPSQQQADQVIAPVKNQIKGQPQWNGHGAYTLGQGANGSVNLNTAVNSAPYAHNQPVDQLNRATFGNALLNHTTRQYANRQSTGNGRTDWKPVGWQQIMHLPNGASHLYDRGHLLGYALVGNIKGFDSSESNPENIVTQTAWANEAGSADSTGQNYYEGIVRQALDQNKTVLYRVKALYSGNELVPRATWIQAKSKDGSININAIVPNAENGVNIDYRTGKGTLGNTDNNSQTSNNQNQARQQNQSNNATDPHAAAGQNDNHDQTQPNNNQTSQTLPRTGHINILHQLAHRIASWF